MLDIELSLTLVTQKMLFFKKIVSTLLLISWDIGVNMYYSGFSHFTSELELYEGLFFEEQTPI